MSVTNFNLLSASDIANISARIAYSHEHSREITIEFGNHLLEQLRPTDPAVRDMTEVTFSKLFMAGVWASINLDYLHNALPEDHYLQEKILRAKRLTKLRSNRQLRVVG